MSGHVVLLGDSIFDNAAYVPGGPSVIEHLRRLLPRDWQATLLAVDGAVVASVFGQLDRLPPSATHLALSAGGNDALWAAGNVFSLDEGTVREALGRIAFERDEFARSYRQLLRELQLLARPLAVCTVYDSVPGLDAAEIAGLCAFNDIITRTAFQVGATLIDLRTICNEATDYSGLSPIEPSASGGGKIARAIANWVLGSGVSSRVLS